VLKYLHENGCPWDERTCEWATHGGHLDMLKYARENGCPWDAGVKLVARDPIIREWLKENGWSFRAS